MVPFITFPKIYVRDSGGFVANSFGIMLSKISFRVMDFQDRYFQLWNVKFNFGNIYSLKVLSSEMDPAEIRLIR